MLGLEFKVWGLRFRDLGLRFRVLSFEFRLLGSGLRTGTLALAWTCWRVTSFGLCMRDLERKAWSCAGWLF